MKLYLIFLASVLFIAACTVQGANTGEATRVTEDIYSNELPVPEKLPPPESPFRVLNQEIDFYHEKIQRLWNGETYTATDARYKIYTNQEINLRSQLECEDFDLGGGYIGTWGKMIIKEDTNGQYTDTTFLNADNVFDAEKVICYAKTSSIEDYEIISELNKTFFSSEYQFPNVENVELSIQNNQLFTEVFVSENKTNAITKYGLEIQIYYQSWGYDEFYYTEEFIDIPQSYLNLTFNETLSDQISFIIFDIYVYSGTGEDQVYTNALGDFHPPLSKTTNGKTKLIPKESSQID